jgi:hypothetical protein
VPAPIPPLYQPPAQPDAPPPAPVGLGSLAPGDLSLPSDDEFRARAATNPLTEAQKLTAGNPAEITALGEDFLRAGSATSPPKGSTQAPATTT